MKVILMQDVTNLGDEDSGWFFVDLFTDQSLAPSLYDDGEAYTSIDDDEPNGPFAKLNRIQLDG